MNTATLTRPVHAAPTAPALPLTREQALDVILTVARRRRLPAPECITAWSHYNGVTIRLPRNERGQVDAWMRALKITQKPTARVDSIVFPGEERAFFPYGTNDEYSGDASSPLLPGVLLTVECYVCVCADPDVHGDGFTLPPTAKPGRVSA